MASQKRHIYYVGSTLNNQGEKKLAKEESRQKEIPTSIISPKKEVKAVKGKVKKITDRGFGFIKTEDGQEVFFHSSKCKDLFESFKKDDPVAFEIAPSQRHPDKTQAVKVRHHRD